jgi:hypothetical protein
MGFSYENQNLGDFIAKNLTIGLARFFGKLPPGYLEELGCFRPGRVFVFNFGTPLRRS